MHKEKLLEVITAIIKEQDRIREEQKVRKSDLEFLRWLHEYLSGHGIDRNLGFMVRLQEIGARESLHRLLTPEELADRYGVSLERLKNWRENRSGGPRWVKIANGSVRYRFEDVLTWELTRMRP